LKFFPFDIHYSLFDLPAMPLIGFEIAPQMLINATDIIARPSICMAGGYSAVLFNKSSNPYPRLCGGQGFSLKIRRELAPLKRV
jgi:hypothetical protein